MRLQEIMTTDVVQIGPDESADAAWARMESEDIRHLVVMENGKLLGVVSQRDLGGAQGAQTRAGKSVRDLMAAQPAVAKPVATFPATLQLGPLTNEFTRDSPRLFQVQFVRRSHTPFRWRKYGRRPCGLRRRPG